MRGQLTSNGLPACHRPVLRSFRAGSAALRARTPLQEDLAYYIFNIKTAGAASRSAVRDRVADLLRVRMWGVDADERHRDSLAPGDLVLLYLGAPDRELIGRAELVSAVYDWKLSEASVFPGDSPSGVRLGEVEEWDPPVPMSAVLTEIDPTENAKADFQAGVVRITPSEYATAVAVATRRRRSAG